MAEDIEVAFYELVRNKDGKFETVCTPDYPYDIHPKIKKRSLDRQPIFEIDSELFIVCWEKFGNCSMNHIVFECPCGWVVIETNRIGCYISHDFELIESNLIVKIKLSSGSIVLDLMPSKCDVCIKCDDE